MCQTNNNNLWKYFCALLRLSLLQRPNEINRYGVRIEWEWYFCVECFLRWNASYFIALCIVVCVVCVFLCVVRTKESPYRIGFIHEFFSLLLVNILSNDAFQRNISSLLRCFPCRFGYDDSFGLRLIFHSMHIFLSVFCNRCFVYTVHTTSGFLDECKVW